MRAPASPFAFHKLPISPKALDKESSAHNNNVTVQYAPWPVRMVHMGIIVDTAFLLRLCAWVITEALLSRQLLLGAL